MGGLVAIPNTEAWPDSRAPSCISANVLVQVSPLCLGFLGYQSRMDLGLLTLYHATLYQSCSVTLHTTRHVLVVVISCSSTFASAWIVIWCVQDLRVAFNMPIVYLIAMYLPHTLLPSLSSLSAAPEANGIVEQPHAILR